MVKTSTTTSTSTYTKSRINVIGDHFELFLRCSNIKDDKIDKMLAAVAKHELSAVGIYVEENNYRVAEVRLEIDWKEHIELQTICGDLFDTDLPGWKDGLAPEAYVSASRLVKAAKEHNLKVASYIVASDYIRKDEDLYKKVCSELGYDYSSSVPQWQSKPKEYTRKIEGLPEVKIKYRQADTDSMN